MNGGEMQLVRRWLIGVVEDMLRARVYRGGKGKRDEEKCCEDHASR